ncbi:AcrR family transcriptional regulator [Catenuloplanes nepalensis]|uniref:AcrR family transcriptional regulator n=1 Tax=Catenuloplanes nepalensis TaxID=587533 RepID=A0ABT9MNI2_9ACTN|nr:TetR/AcrR family transcriptional regulator [Catenuloplanes nepalensis]MDP9792975.1 AcrR family transcriptional regulator [Catenuloplanes nepalensis]
MTDTAASPRRGRPRDPGVEDRVFDAAIDLYSRLGWAGFSFESVTRITGVGKAALYRRWPTRSALLVETLRARWYTVGDIDTGRLRDDLRKLADMLLTRLTGPHGSVHLQILMDTRNYDEVRDATAAYRADLVLAGRAMARRAVARGELPPGTNPTLIIDLVVGGIQNHVLATPPELKSKMQEQMHRYGEQLVDAVLAGATARGD